MNGTARAGLMLGLLVMFLDGCNPAPSSEEASATSDIRGKGKGRAKLTLTWQDNATSEDGFLVERKVGTDGAYAQLASLGANTTTYVDQAVDFGIVYCYRVHASNAAGASANTNEACAS